MSLSYDRTIRLHFDVLLISIQISIPSVFSLCRTLILFLMFQDQRFFLSLDLPSWVRVEGRLVRFSEILDMDQQVVTIDQFTAAMASIQEALTSLRQEIGSQQSRPPVVQDETLHDSLPPLPSSPIPTGPQASPYPLHGHSEVAPPAVV